MNQQARPAISVMVAMYNYGRYLRECLESVLAQTCGVSAEIIAVDDGSEDDSREIAASFPQVRVIAQEHRGVAAARNRALAEARGEYLCFIDADDLWAPDKLELQMNYLAEHPDCPIVCCRYENFVDSGNFDETVRARLDNCAQHDRRYLCSALMRRVLFLRYGGFDETLRTGEDTEWMGRLMFDHISVGFIDKTLYLRRLHGENLTCRFFVQEKRRMADNVLKVFSGSLRRAIQAQREGISVIIPAHNAQDYIAEAVESALGQQRSMPLDVVVVDDGSDDQTSEEVSGKNVTLIRQERRGAAAARNRGIMNSHSSWLFFLDADDVLCPGSLQLLWDAARENPEADAVFSMARDFVQSELSDEFAASGAPYAGCLPGCVLIRRDAFKRVGMFDESLKTGETVDWLLRFKDRALPSVTVDAVTLLRRVHKNNAGALRAQQEKKDYAAILRARLKRKKEERSR